MQVSTVHALTFPSLPLPVQRLAHDAAKHLSGAAVISACFRSFPSRPIFCLFWGP